MLIRMISAAIRWFIHLLLDPISKACNVNGLLDFFLNQHAHGEGKFGVFLRYVYIQILISFKLACFRKSFRCCWSPFFVDSPCPWICQLLLSRELIVTQNSATCHETLQTWRGNFISINICNIHSKVSSMTNVWSQLVPDEDRKLGSCTLICISKYILLLHLEQPLILCKLEREI